MKKRNILIGKKEVFDQNLKKGIKNGFMGIFIEMQSYKDLEIIVTVIGGLWQLIYLLNSRKYREGG